MRIPRHDPSDLNSAERARAFYRNHKYQADGHSRCHRRSRRYRIGIPDACRNRLLAEATHYIYYAGGGPCDKARRLFHRFPYSQFSPSLNVMLPLWAGFPFMNVSTVKQPLLLHIPSGVVLNLDEYSFPPMRIVDTFYLLPVVIHRSMTLPLLSLGLLIE